MEEEQNNEEIEQTQENKKKRKSEKKEKENNNNLDKIEKQLKAEYQNEEKKKCKSYSQLIELKKEENLINLNIQYFENLLMKLKYNE